MLQIYPRKMDNLNHANHMNHPHQFKTWEKHVGWEVQWKWSDPGEVRHWSWGALGLKWTKSWGTWSEVSADPALSRILEQRPPKVPSSLNKTDLKRPVPKSINILSQQLGFIQKRKQVCIQNTQKSSLAFSWFWEGFCKIRTSDLMNISEEGKADSWVST